MRLYGALLLALLALPVVAQENQGVLLVCHKHDDTLSYIDVATLTVLDTIKTGPNPHEIIVSPDQRFAYLSNYAAPGNTISLIDIPGHKHLQQISTGEYHRIHGTAMAPNGKRAYFTAGQRGYVVEVDTTTNTMVRAIPTEGKTSHMVYVGPEGKRLVTANIKSEDVSVIDIASGKVLKKIPCGPGCEGMAFSPDKKQLWALNQSGGSCTIIDVARLEAIETFPCPDMPVRILFSHDGQRAYIAHWAKAGRLTVLDVATRKAIKEIPVGARAIGLALSPDGKRLFVGCEQRDGIHVIDCDRLKVTKILKTGNGPDPMVIIRKAE